MKRLLHIQFLLVLLLALGYSPLQAKRITQWQAQQQAYSFWGKQMPQKAKAKSRTATTASPSDAYYVFNNDAGGFVIIAGDDAVTPVLGYTSTGSFDAENLPDGLKDLLKSYERQIAALGDNYVANQTATRAGFTGEKLLNTAEWNQMAPFNKYTPNNYVTGCVATAGAIVMKHHGYPAKGTGSHSYTWNGKTLTANFEHTYDWASMPAIYDGTNDAAFDGVARLMADLGVAVEMQYNKDGSGAYIGNLVTALQKYYGYSKLSHLMAIEDVGAEAWNGRLREEIDANRPVLYAASDPARGGHAFVIDGYKDESFSVNWGWGGYCDGFYQIGALNPESNGKPEGDKYNVGQSAVFGMEPSDGTEKISGMGFMTNVGRFHILNMNITDVKKGQKVGIFCAPIGNTGDQPFTGEVDVALMNAKGEMRKIVTSIPLTVDDLDPGYYYSSPSFNFVSTVDAEPGDYLAIVAKEKGSSEYIELYDSNFERLRLPATGYVPRTYEIRTKVGEGATIKQAETWYNPSTNFYNGKPVIGAYYCYYLTLDAGIANCCVELNGELVNDINLGTDQPNSFRGIEPVYTLEVKTYRNYQEKDTTINLMGAGTLKQALANGNPDYFVYRNIKVNGEIDKRDFDELASHYFKSIDLSGAKVVAYDGYKADMVPDYAFDGNTYLEHFKMPAGVRELGFNAFMSTNLKEIDLPETIEEFGRNTFNSCFELTDVYMRHKEAPYWISWCVFANKSSRLYRTLHLYPGSKAKYEAHQYTQNWIVYFDNVVEDLEPTGIHSVTLDKETGNKAIYDLNGRRIQNVPSRGIYIQNGKKISVK
ncbi:C10 family peptidase [Prevotella copri]|uniref:C10 family peptidase n=1 Tax=Segatella copri TaxID=165179 RepID=A0AAW5U5H8_9BACT|nr:C10 family peptidase [Segatella copri]MCW4098093.1 C10 family peptidase [Segatella copri]MCW4131373.1 C10 family peptidase [Segatella copri]MCW4162407.1 C10 family peptidase [Segatella copri]